MNLHKYGCIAQGCADQLALSDVEELWTERNSRNTRAVDGLKIIFSLINSKR